VTNDSGANTVSAASKAGILDFMINLHTSIEAVAGYSESATVCA